MTEPAPNPDQPHGGTLETSLPAALWSIARAIEFTKRSLKELGCPPSAQTSLVVIVDEIASNIAKFAYGESGGDVTIRISAKPDECDIEIAFIDEGVAFNPLEAHAADAAVMLVVGILIGEENREGIMQICRLTLRYIGIAVGAVALVFFVGAPWFAGLYATGDAEVAGLATFAIRCMAVNLVLNALIEAYINFLQATEQTLKTHIVNIASRFACVVICAFVLGSLFGINGVWLASPWGRSY